MLTIKPSSSATRAKALIGAASLLVALGTVSPLSAQTRQRTNERGTYQAPTTNDVQVNPLRAPQPSSASQQQAGVQATAEQETVAQASAKQHSGARKSSVRRNSMRKTGVRKSASSNPSAAPVQKISVVEQAELVRPAQLQTIQVDESPQLNSVPQPIEVIENAQPMVDQPTGSGLNPNHFNGEYDEYADYDDGHFATDGGASGNCGCSSGGCSGGGCDGWSNHCGGCNACGSMIGPRFPWQQFFGSVEYMMSWRQSQTLPPLVTTSPTGTDRDLAGQLGQSTTSILVGGNPTWGMSSGGRVQLGMWFDPSHCTSALVRFWASGEKSSQYNVGSNAAAFVAIPFNNASLGQPDAFLITAENESRGSINIRGKSEFYGGDALMQNHLISALGAHTESFWGYQTARINESIDISANSTRIAPDPGAGQQIATHDSFGVSNEFHGAAFGFNSTYREGRVAWRLFTKFGFGTLRRKAKIYGSTVQSNGGTSVTTDEGFFARDSNIGTTSSSRFSFSPEINLSLGYALAPGLDFTFGYNYLLFTNVVQPGTVIDTTTTDIAATGGGRPSVHFSGDTYWIQGIQFGLNYQY